MATLRQGLPNITDEVIAAASGDDALNEALLDYQRVCERIQNEKLPPEDVELWVEIRAELFAEIGSLYLCVKHRDNESNGHKSQDSID